MQSVQHMVRTGRRGPMHEFSMAFADLRASFERIGLAWSLAWHDVVSRYRGSILGPFWITLSMGLMVAGIGFLYANLFKVPVNEFIPYVALGILTFTTFDLSPTAKLVYAYVTYIALTLVYTMINVPYSAMLGVLTPDPEERTVLSSAGAARAQPLRPPSRSTSDWCRCQPLDMMLGKGGRHMKVAW